MVEGRGSRGEKEWVRNRGKGKEWMSSSGNGDEEREERRKAGWCVGVEAKGMEKENRCV